MFVALWADGLALVVVVARAEVREDEASELSVLGDHSQIAARDAPAKTAATTASTSSRKENFICSTNAFVEWIFGN
jgi:predicted naringenin-chalcone synthase